jgi:hypothetical protein
MNTNANRLWSIHQLGNEMGILPTSGSCFEPRSQYDTNAPFSGEGLL